MACRVGILIQRFLNSPRISKYGETIGLGSVNLSGKGVGEILIFSCFSWLTVSFSCSTSISVIFFCLDSVGALDSNYSGVVPYASEIIRHDLNLSSLHCFCSISGFGFSIIWIN